jgi:hypothetical protein
LIDPYHRWREEPVYLLDDCFDCSDAYQALTSAGFLLRRHRECFPSEGLGPERGVKDSRIIELCGREGWILVTTDANISRMFRKEIAQASDIAILATSHNQVGNIMEWVAGLQKLKNRLDQNNFRKKPRPWFARFNRQGEFTTGPQLVIWRD